MVACADLSGCASSIDVISFGNFTPLPHQPGGRVGSIVRQGRNAFAVLRDAGGVGELAVSHDGGTSWERRALPQQYCTYSLGPAMTITTNGDIYLICANGASAGTEQKDLYVSDNSALSWQHVAELESYGYADAIIAATPDMLWRDGGRAPIYARTDAGKTWHTQLADKVGDAAGPETQAFAAAGTNALVFAFALPPSARSPVRGRSTSIASPTQVLTGKPFPYNPERPPIALSRTSQDHSTHPRHLRQMRFVPAHGRVGGEGASVRTTDPVDRSVGADVDRVV
jgi:hypothetical protein